MANLEGETRIDKPEGELRRGWTTGACATAAAKAALTALLSGAFPDPVTIRLPKGETPAFPLAFEKLGEAEAAAGIIKDAGDDPDVTHGAMIVATVRRGVSQSGIRFFAGEGVGMVTRPGLPVAVGEPAINPVPRAMMVETLGEVCASFGIAADLEVTISVPGGARIAERTWNPRLGIAGGISILGTTGIVVPFSCSAWIHSIHRGIDVCRANGIGHVLGATGSTSEAAARRLHDFDDVACLDMGDFVGGMLKYLRKNPVPRLTIAGGIAKMAKLAQGALDLHSSRSQVDFLQLAALAERAGVDRDAKVMLQSANTALEAHEMIRNSSPRAAAAFCAAIAADSQAKAVGFLGDSKVEVEVLVVSRSGEILARAGAFDG
jgi:cobalt-precorrin-5B (C1)-methyltransferase